MSGSEFSNLGSDRITDGEPGPGAGPDKPRWPRAPPQRRGPNGVENERDRCPACEAASTLSYRCSECGKDLAGSGSGEANAGGRQ